MVYRGFFAASLAVAVLVASVVLAPGGSRAQAPQPEQSPPAAAAPQGKAHVTTPYGDVRVEADRSKVSVEAPYSSVKVDADSGQVKVRAPYVNLDVRF